jgi:serine phosphatase RsbU (regulator of sigma subunit)
MLHQSFLLGAMYELDYFGEITIKLFENLNSRFFRSSGVHKYLTLLYGEITEQGRFRFISAAHPLPVVFSRRFDRFMDIAPEHLTTFPPIGTLPSQEDIDHRKALSVLPFKENYEINEINLMGTGDILLLSTDGLTEHSNGAADYFPNQLEKKLREVKDLSAHKICKAIEDDIRAFGTVQDDLSYVVLKKL